MVVWFIAAMSLLVVGIVSEARTDVRMAQTHVARAKAAAAGDGAINLLLAQQGQLREQQGTIPGLVEEPVLEAAFTIGELPVQVRMVPVSRLLDLRSAGPAQLAELFASAGGLDRGDAQRLANTVVQLRNSSGGPRLQAVEEWLRVPGFDRALLDALRDDIRMDDGASYRLDALLEYNGRPWLRRRWVSLQGGMDGSGLPWQTTRTEAPRVPGNTITAGER
ncbi:MAG: hypothetical protein ACNA7T_09995 [Haliea sp.]